MPGNVYQRCVSQVGTANGRQDSMIPKEETVAPAEAQGDEDSHKKQD